MSVSPPDERGSLGRSGVDYGVGITCVVHIDLPPCLCCSGQLGFAAKDAYISRRRQQVYYKINFSRMRIHEICVIGTRGSSSTRVSSRNNFTRNGGAMSVVATAINSTTP